MNFQMSDARDQQNTRDNLFRVIEICGDEINLLRRICSDLYYGRSGAFDRLERGMAAYEEYQSNEKTFAQD